RHGLHPEVSGANGQATGKPHGGRRVGCIDDGFACAVEENRTVVSAERLTMALGGEGAAIPIALVLLNGREIRLEWKQDRETIRFRVESEEEKTVDIKEVAQGIYSLLIDGRSYEAHADGESVSIGGRRFPAEVVDPRRWNRQRNHRPPEGLENIVAAMPGKVVRVLVAVGDQVEVGQGIVVVEAM